MKTVLGVLMAAIMLVVVYGDCCGECGVGGPCMCASISDGCCGVGACNIFCCNCNDGCQAGDRRLRSLLDIGKEPTRYRAKDPESLKKRAELLFAEADQGGKGYLDIEDVKHHFLDLGKVLDDDEALAKLRTVDQNGDDKISPGEFDNTLA